MTALPIKAIKVTQRHRHDLGDIAALAESMTEVGLLHPVVVTANHHLVAGERRLAAARSLGWTEIDVTVAANLTEAATLLRAESDENTCRKDFTPTEAAAIRKAREELLKPLAPQGRPPKGSNLEPLGKVAKVAAVGTGYSATTLNKVDHVAAVAADDSRPAPVREVAKQALNAMDTTGKVDGPYREVTLADEYAAAVEEFPELGPEQSPGLPEAEVVRVANDLRAVPEGPEREKRRKTAATWHRAYALHAEGSEPDPYVAADRIVAVVADALDRIEALGGADAFATGAAVAEDRLSLDTWAADIDAAITLFGRLRDACRPELRRVK